MSLLQLLNSSLVAQKQAKAKSKQVSMVEFHANPCQPWSLLPGWNCPDSESIIPPDSVFLPSRYPAEGLRWQDTESAGGSVSHHTCSCPSPWETSLLTGVGAGLTQQGAVTMASISLAGLSPLGRGPGSKVSPGLGMPV